MGIYLAENKLLQLSLAVDGRSPHVLFAIFEHDDGGQLTTEG